MDIKYIKNRLKKQEDVLLLEKAYQFANKKLSDLSYINKHIILNDILEITNTLIDFNADTLTLVSSILSKIISCGTNKDEIEKEFNSTITNISYGASIITDKEKLDNTQINYLNKLNPNSDVDARILFIKLAKTFYYMKNMTYISIEEQQEISRDTLNILVPIASKHRLNYIKSIIEDLCLYYLNKDAYNDILTKLDATPDTLKIYLNIMKENISTLLIKNNINFQIKSRVKSIYSIYNKLESGREWSDIYDILAIRILVETKEECKLVADIIHSQYIPLPSRIKDFINNPKDNMYQSLHTTIIGIDNRYYEIQIRTHDMNKMAELGSASHHLYKEKQLKKIKRK